MLNPIEMCMMLMLRQDGDANEKEARKIQEGLLAETQFAQCVKANGGDIAILSGTDGSGAPLQTMARGGTGGGSQPLPTVDK